MVRPEREGTDQDSSIVFPQSLSAVPSSDTVPCITQVLPSTAYHLNLPVFSWPIHCQMIPPHGSLPYTLPAVMSHLVLKSGTEYPRLLKKHGHGPSVDISPEAFRPVIHEKSKIGSIAVFNSFFRLYTDKARPFPLSRLWPPSPEQ